MSIIDVLKKQPSWRKFIHTSLLVLLATYILICIDFFVRQESYLFEPDADPTDWRASGLEEKEFVLSVQQQGGGEAMIHYRKYVTKSMPSKGSVFYLHGNKGNMDLCEWEIEFLIEHGYDVWTMDYRGYGQSSGTMSENALKEDANGVYDKIVKEVSAESLLIWGRSFGSGVTAFVAAETVKKPKMLVLETPYWSLVDAARQKHSYLLPILFRYELPTYDFLKSASCPIHLIHGTQDEKIPFNSSERLFVHCEALGIPIIGHPIMSGKHNLRDREKEFEEIHSKILK